MELINDGGWHGARLPELRGDIYQKLRDLLGDISPDGDSLIGQVMAVVAENDLNIVEAIGWTFAGFFISSGEGIQLDGIGEGFTLPRYGLTRSSADVVYLLASGQVIASGEAFTISGISGDWSPSGSIQANGKSAAGFVLEVKPDAITPGNTFTISINGKPYSTQYQTGDTSDSILSRLYPIIAAADTSVATYSTDYGLLLYAADCKSLIQFSFSDDVFSIVRTGMPATTWYDSDTEFPDVRFGYVATDDILILANGSKGFEIEDDEQYRERLFEAAEAGRKNVSASRPGIKNAVLAVAGVSYVTVNTNRGIETDADGLPGKSVQVFVAGGDSDEIAQAIYDAAAAEFGFYGNTSGTATDGTTTETVYFTRQSFQLVYVSVSGDTWDAETTGKPDDYESVAKSVITGYFSQLEMGRDVFAGQISARLVTAFPTMTDITVTVGTSESPTGKTVPISSGVVAVTDSTSVVVS